MTTYKINENSFRDTVRKLLKATATLTEQETIGDKALLPSRPEGLPIDDVTGVEEPMEDSEEVIERQPVSKSNGRDIKAQRRLELIAEEAAVDLEEPIVSKLNLVDPNDMSMEDQEKYIEIMDIMQEKVRAAVMEAVSQLSSLPKVEDEE